MANPSMETWQDVEIEEIRPAILGQISDNRQRQTLQRQSELQSLRKDETREGRMKRKKTGRKKGSVTKVANLALCGLIICFAEMHILFRRALAQGPRFVERATRASLHLRHSTNAW